jgi:hypothetical protein
MDYDEMVQKVQDGEMNMLDFVLEQEELAELQVQKRLMRIPATLSGLSQRNELLHTLKQYVEEKKHRFT